MRFASEKRLNDTFMASCHKYVPVNTTVTKYPHKIEFLYRDSVSLVRQKSLECEDVKISDRSRKFHINASGVLVPNSDKVLFSQFLRSREQSRLRALDSSYRYALSNTWAYFCTFTFDPKKVERTNDEACKHCWQLFRQRLQYLFPDIKIYCVPEYHEKGSLHFHALIGNADLSAYLEVATFPDGKPNAGDIITTRYGDTVYNFDVDLYEFGFTTVVPIQSEDDNEKVVNYLVKYVHKSKGMSYNQKSYYHTHNLRQAEKLSAFMSFDELIELLTNHPSLDLQDSDYFVNERKRTKNYIVFDTIGILPSIFSQKLCFANSLEKGLCSFLYQKILKRTD